MKIETWTIQGRGFHFGKHGMGQEESKPIFTSDSLFAALVATLALTQNGQGGMFVEPFMEQILCTPPAFVLTSAFPRVGNVRFYPLPRWSIHQAQQTHPGENLDPKTVKKIGFVSENLFKELISGTPITSLIQQAKFLQQHTLLCSNNEFKQLPKALQTEGAPVWEIEQRPRVSIDRLQASSNLYFTGRTFFAQECGLWFGLRWFTEDQAIKKIVKNLFSILGDNGLGAERSSGFGQAKIEQQGEINLPEPNPASPWVTLSRYIPNPNETGALQFEHAAYQLERVGGWAQSVETPSQRRQTVHMISEGSVMGPLPSLSYGQIVDVKPVYAGINPSGHPVWRSGLAFGVALSTREKGD